MTAILAALLLIFALPVVSGAAPSSLRPEQFADLAFHEHPGSRLPLGAGLVDEQGKAAPLGQFFDGKPVVLALAYFRCRTLCGTVLGNLAEALNGVPLDAGRDFQVIVISIDPRDTSGDALTAKAKDLARYRHAGGNGGWHFLRGSENAVRNIAEIVGFPYRFDPAIDQYAHPAGVTLVTADGTISRYVLGIDYRPIDFRLGLIAAGSGQVSSVISHFLLLCYGYDPQQGRYTSQIEAGLIILNVAGVLGFIAIMAAVYRRRNG